MSEILFRLIKDKTIVGYERHENGKIYHTANGGKWQDIFNFLPAYLSVKRPFYIPHDRKDRFTGIEVGGVKVFERDKATINDGRDGSGKREQYVCEYESGSFIFNSLESGKGFYLHYVNGNSDKTIELIGVDGVEG